MVFIMLGRLFNASGQVGKEIDNRFVHVVSLLSFVFCLLSFVFVMK